MTSTFHHNTIAYSRRRHRAEPDRGGVPPAERSTAPDVVDLAVVAAGVKDRVEQLVDAVPSSPQVERLCGRRPHAVQFRGVWVRELDGAGCVGGHRETAEETESANRSGTVRLGEFWLTHLVDTSAQFMYCNDVQFELFYFAYKTCFRFEWSHLKFRKKLWLLFNFHVYTFPSWIRLPDEAFVTLAYWSACSPSTLLIQVLISMKACEIV